MGLPDRTAIVETGRDCSVAAAIDADAAAVVEGIGPGLDVDHAGGAQAILRRQRAGDQRHVSDQRGIEDLAEAADAVRHHDSVDTILQVRVFVAHMEIAARRGILRHSRCLQQNLVERRIGPLRQRLDRLMAQLVGDRAERCDDVLSRLIERFGLARKCFGCGGLGNVRLLPAVLGHDPCPGPPGAMRCAWCPHHDLGQGRGTCGRRLRGRMMRDCDAAEARQQQRGGAGHERRTFSQR